MTGERRRALVAVGVAVAVFLLARLRGSFEPYVALHRWLDACGVPPAVRGLDYSAWILVGCWLAARLAWGRGRVLDGLGLRHGVIAGVTFGVVAGLPMLLQGVLGASTFRCDFGIARGVLLAPLVEELFFRAVLVGIPTRLGGLPFWPIAIAAAAVFGSVHVPWDAAWHGGHYGVFAATFAGGLWYAWLVRVFAGNLWTTITLHAVMNAAWMVTGVAGDAGGGLWPNLGRAGTIALGTVLAIRHRRGKSWVDGGGGQGR